MTKKQRTELEKVLPKMNGILEKLDDLQQKVFKLMDEIDDKTYKILMDAGALETFDAFTELYTGTYDIEFIIEQLEDL